MSDASAPSSSDPLGRLGALLGSAENRRKLPPVERWNPPDCGDLDLRIDREGRWIHEGRAIERSALVRLFSTVLRRDGDRYVLVTPVERIGITVEDVPFLAVAMAVEGDGEQRTVAFRTNVGDLVAVGPDHPLRFEGVEDALKPYVRVRGGLWARLTRALTFDLVELIEERDVDGVAVLGVGAGGTFFPLSPAVSRDGEA